MLDPKLLKAMAADKKGADGQEAGIINFRAVLKPVGAVERRSLLSLPRGPR